MRIWAFVALTLIGCGDKDGEETVTDTGPDTDPTADADGDGAAAGLDCDDNDPAAYPGAAEICDEVDNDCDGEIDEGYDADADSYTTCGGDCDDTDTDIHPGAEDIAYDSIDQDCDGADNNDFDGDGYAGTKGGGDDCDDTDDSISPGAEDIPYDGIDQDCDGFDVTDVDGDGYDAIEAGGEDCDDTDPNLYPGVETGTPDFLNDGIDSDCDGEDGAAFDMEEGTITISSGGLTGNDVVLCDISGDGNDDLVVASPFGASYGGSVGVYYGSGSGSWGTSMALSDADIRISDSGTTPAMFLGFGLVCGDFDGDGKNDLMTGRGEIDYSPYISDFTVYLFSNDTLTSSPSFSSSSADAELVYSLGVVTDVNNLVVYSKTLWSGDFDGDGVDELAVDMGRYYDSTTGRYLNPNGDGAIWIVDVAAASGAGLDLSAYVSDRITPDSEDSTTWVTAADDFDGDGAPDIGIGQSFWDDGTIVTGLLSWMGAADTGDLEDLESASIIPTAEEVFGFQGAFGDFDGDGLEDMVVSGIYASDSDTFGGKLYLFSDAASVLTSTGLDPESIASATIVGDYEYGFLGYRLANLGDYDGDGADDLLIAEPNGGPSYWGRVYALSGAAMSGTDLDVDDIALFEWQAQKWSGISDPTSELRFAIATDAGDIDGDGYADVVISDSLADSDGVVYVYLSSEMGF